MAGQAALAPGMGEQHKTVSQQPTQMSMVKPDRKTESRDKVHAVVSAQKSFQAQVSSFLSYAFLGPEGAGALAVFHVGIAIAQHQVLLLGNAH